MTIFQVNGQSVAIMNLNYTVAKTLASALTEAIAEYERKFNTKVPEIDFSSFGPGRVVVTPKQ